MNNIDILFPVSSEYANNLAHDELIAISGAQPPVQEKNTYDAKDVVALTGYGLIVSAVAIAGYVAHKRNIRDRNQQKDNH